MTDAKAEAEVNSKAYWDDRFADDWDTQGGREQSRTFIDLLIKFLPAAVYEELAKGLSVLDCGCAKGDGTALLAREFPRSSVAGFDFSATAIEQAQASYPGVEFFVSDFTALERSADVLICSNCLEHLKDAISALHRLLSRARSRVVLLVPFRETYPPHEEHVRVVHMQTFPRRLAGWRQSHRITIGPSAAWAEEQLLLIYEPEPARLRTARARRLALEAQLAQEEAREREAADRLVARLAALEGEVTRLRGALDGRRNSRLRRLGRRFRDAIQSLLLWMWRHLWPGQRLLSWHTYSFDAYRRQRERLYGRDLSGVRPPEVPGLVSIVLPVYNGADLVREALDSILAQTYSTFELIAIDDGSTDGTGEILDEYARRDPRIRVFHQENCRIPRTLSRGFRLACGELLTWTSADNRLKPVFLERMVDCLRRHPAWDMVYANLDIIGDDGRPLLDSEWYRAYQVPEGSEHIHLPRDVSDLNVRANNYVGAAFLYRSRAAWLLGDYSPIRFTTEDYDYWMRANALLTLRHADFDEPVYEYRFHAKSLTARDEELGITRYRGKLMAFDDFRRDLFLSSMIWCLEGEGSVIRALGRRITEAGHVLAAPGEWAPDLLPRLWLPYAYVRVADRRTAVSPPPTGLPASALRVLVMVGGGQLPAEVDPGWDLCVSLGDGKQAGHPRLDGDYRGWLAIRDVPSLFATVDIRTRSALLAQVEREIEAEGASGGAPRPRASVILCTYRRSERLARAIESVSRQTLPPSEYEVLVVDNQPRDAALRRQIEELGKRCFDGNPDRFRLVLCPLAGLSHARNAGISEARGEILCFLDDDAVAREDWVEQVCRAFADHPAAGVIGGHIVLEPPDPRPRALSRGWEVYWSHLVTEHREYTAATSWIQFPWGANWSARRKALCEIGGFRTRYGRCGNDFSGGEELTAAITAYHVGYEIGLAPEASVRHDVEPSRYSFRHVRRTILSATMVVYRMQRDLYLTMEERIGDTLRNLLRTPAHPSPGEGMRARVLHHLYRKESFLRVLLAHLRDIQRRRRPPVSLSD